MEDHEIKDAILRKLSNYNEEDNRIINLDTSNFKELQIKNELIIAYFEEIESDGYIKKRSGFGHTVQIAPAGVKFHRDGGYTKEKEVEQEQEAEQVKRDEKLDKLNSLSIATLKFDLPIKIITAIIAIAGLTISLIAIIQD